jgi:hypothetical protein
MLRRPRDFPLSRLYGQTPISSRDFPWAKACCLVREPDAGNLHVRFDEGGVETGLGQGYLGTARRKGRRPLCKTYCYRATSLLYQVQLFQQYEADMAACRLRPLKNPNPVRIARPYGAPRIPKVVQVCDSFTDGKDELMLVERSAEKYRQNLSGGLWCVECSF